MKAPFRLAGIGFLIILLILIRYFEATLFYDPLLNFYNLDYLHNKIPHFETWKLLTHVCFRFFLNSIISLGILYIAFLDKNIVKFSILLYAVLFIATFSVFLFLVFSMGPPNYMMLFYVRRFLIHPVFVIILLPAFYYYRLTSRQRNSN